MTMMISPHNTKSHYIGRLMTWLVQQSCAD
jgi:hypothetical protein